MNDSTNLGVGRLFLRDLIVVVLLLREVRDRVVARLFGVPKEDAAVLTFIAGGRAADSVHDSAVRVLHTRPAAADVAIGAAVVREAAYTLAGEQSRDVPALGLVVGLSVLDRTYRPMLRATYHGVREASHAVERWPHRFRLALDRYYGR
ncbi:MAG: hypothetical protein ACXVVQ_20790 [Solirubrobacteraceae bacterium]